MAELRQYSEQTDREIRAVLERYRQSRTFELGPVPYDSIAGQRQVRWARTTTDATNPTYPTHTANKFVIEFGDFKFDDANLTNETASFTADSPQTTRIAYSRFGWLPNQTVVRVSEHYGRWYIDPDYTLTRHKAKSTSTIADGASGTVNIWKNGAVTSPVWSVTAWLNWMNGTTTVASGAELIIEWFQDESSGAGKWIITEMEC